MGYLDDKKPNSDDPFVQEIDNLIEWFCGKINEPVPFHKQDKANVYQRMISTGWIRQSELDTYKILTSEKDDEI